MPEVWLELDTALRERLRDLLAEPKRPVTETELRRLADDGRAYTRILRAELGRLQQRLDELDRDPNSSLGAIAGAFRRVHDFRSHVDELEHLLAALDARAREMRTSWLLGER